MSTPTLKNLFDQDGTVVQVGGAQYLTWLAEAAVLVTNADDYAHLILDLASRRELVAACEQALDDVLRITPDRPATVVIREHAIRVERAVLRRADCRPTCTRIADWLQRDILSPDQLLGELLSTTSRMMLIGPTGLRKTNFALAVGIPIANGDPLLHWRASDGPRRVLLIDGEMSNRQMKRRLVDAARRAGRIPDTFHVLSLDDLPDMEPLDTEAGQRYIDGVIASIGGVDLVMFDNIQALLSDDENFWCPKLAASPPLDSRSYSPLRWPDLGSSHGTK